MQDIITPTSYRSGADHDHHNRHTAAIVLGLIAAIIIIVLAVYTYRNHLAQPARSDLQLLEESSNPITTTPEEQVRAMQQLQGQQQTTLSAQERQDMLNALQ